jgi:hypothetical protein
VIEFPLPSSCPFFLHFLPPCIIFLHLWLFFAIGSIHQEAQAVKFNCSCTSGLLRLQLSSTDFQVQLLGVLPDFSGFNCLSRSIVTVLPDYSGYNCFLRLFFRNFYLVINIYLLILNNSLSIKNIARLISIIDLKDSNPKL